MCSDCSRRVVVVVVRVQGRVWDHVLETYTRTSEIHQTLCMLLYIDFSISDIYSENTKGMEPRLVISLLVGGIPDCHCNRIAYLGQLLTILGPMVCPSHTTSMYIR